MLGIIAHLFFNKLTVPGMSHLVAFIEGLGGPEMMMIMAIILLLFGANKLPELAKGLGKSVREFKKASSGVEDEIRKAMETPEEPHPKESSVNLPSVTSGSMEKQAPPTNAR